MLPEALLLMKRLDVRTHFTIEYCAVPSHTEKSNLRGKALRDQFHGSIFVSLLPCTKVALQWR